MLNLVLTADIPVCDKGYYWDHGGKLPYPSFFASGVSGIFQTMLHEIGKEQHLAREALKRKPALSDSEQELARKLGDLGDLGDSPEDVDKLFKATTDRDRELMFRVLWFDRLSRRPPCQPRVLQDAKDVDNSKPVLAARAGPFDYDPDLWWQPPDVEYWDWRWHLASDRPLNHGKDLLDLDARLFASQTSEHDPLSLSFYDPFKRDPALFVLFSQVHPTQEGILSFATRYGDLLKDMTPLSFWRGEITKMQHALELLAALREGKDETIRKHVFWNKQKQLAWPSPFIRVSCGPESSLSGLVEIDPRFSPRRHRAPDLIGPAQDVLDYLIWQTTAVGTLRPRRSSSGVMTLHMEARNLLAALWLQFARACAEDLDYRHCGSCGRPFEISPQTNRSDRIFCSDGCRIKAHRTRRANAVKMRSQGQSPQQIAKELGSDVETVKGWVAAVPKGKPK